MLVVVLCVLMTTLTLTTAFNHSPWPSTLSSSRARVLRMGETREVDVAVIGAGVGGMTISWMLAERENLETALIDPQVESGSWYPNYGSWSKEWDALSAKLDLPELKQCLTNEWEYTDCFFGGSNDVPMTQRTTLQQPYVRVDKKKMRDLYLSRFKASGNGVTIPSKLTTRCIGPNLFESEKIHHADTHTLLTLDNGDVVKCKVVIDATGPESSLVAREDPVYARGGGAPELQTGYQIAYGFVAHVDSTGPYDPKACTLFDYRTDHFPSSSSSSSSSSASDKEEERDACERPTFMYVMPLEEHQDGTHTVFFEETSLVGVGARRLEFKVCKDRAMKRLAHHGITVLGMGEEEYCYIPMGGELPDRHQRVVAFGGAANMVHPSTGYQVCRMLASASDVSKTVGEGIRANTSLDALTTMAHSAIWTAQARGQRDFQVYGGDFLEQQPVSVLRGFFAAFFALEDEAWGGFLAGYPSLPGSSVHETWNSRLFSFALRIFLNMPNDVRAAMVLYSIKHTLVMGPNILLRSITPPALFSSAAQNGVSSEEAYLQLSKVVSTSRAGDAAAKTEARAMMKGFVPSGRFHARGGAGGEEENANEGTGKGAAPAPFHK